MTVTVTDVSVAPPPPHNIFPAKMVADLKASGLVPEDMRCKPISNSEKAATGSPMGADGYVIPYYGLNGQPIQHYRVKLFDAQVKYRQPADTPNYIYFPPGLAALLPTAEYILVTEGEKKAAKAVKEGFPCIALGGVDNWKTRTLILPKDVALSTKPNGTLTAKLPSGKSVGEGAETLAHGFQEFMDFVVRRNIPIIIAFDTDEFNNGQPRVKDEVQRAAAVLGFELRFRGVPIRNIRQVVLPWCGAKTGLDDLLSQEDGMGSIRLQSGITQVRAKRSAFPCHPNTRDYVNKKLQRTQISRSEQMGTAMAILTDMDARGQRLRSPDSGSLYYFEAAAKSLTEVNFSGRPDFAESPFGRKLYRDYGLGVNDQRILGWVSSQYSGEEPISDVYPEKVMTWRGDTLYYHINDGTIAKVTKDGITLLDNGEDEVLFEAGPIEGVDTAEFKTALAVVEAQPIENWWYKVLQEARIRQDGAADKQRHLLSLLYYVSPLFYRWRGTQLPVEITTGEAGSGKSTMYEFRLGVLTGVPKLRNAPSDLKDWNASLAASGGLHVTDNVQLLDNSLRQRLSDEICRLVTEPNPSIEQRKLYSDTALVKIPVKVVFAITAIRQPFQNVDIIQRSIITELDKGIDADLTYDADWKSRQMESRGGRANWLAHQLLFVQHMLQLIDKHWDKKYKAKYRLINLEQLLMFCSRVLGEDPSWIANHLEKSRDSKATDADWTLDGLSHYAEHIKHKYPSKWQNFRFPVAEITSWAQGDDDYKECTILQSSRTLARYMNQNKHTIATTANIVPCGVTGNKQMYKIGKAS